MHKLIILMCLVVLTGFSTAWGAQGEINVSDTAIQVNDINETSVVNDSEKLSDTSESSGIKQEKEITEQTETKQETVDDDKVMDEETKISDTADSDPKTVLIEEEAPEHGFGHKLLFYLPNRFLDIFDFVRVRVRVGPGFAVGARVTKPLSFLLGGYASVYAGLPGPRMAPKIKLPVGIENFAGMSLSFLGSDTKGGRLPGYSPTEIGVGFQLLLVGTDIGVDPVEVLDLALGFLFIDLRGDDL